MLLNLFYLMWRKELFIIKNIITLDSMNLVKPFLLFVALLFCINSYGQTSIMSYNIRYDTQNDKEDWWGNRKGEIVQMLHYYHPDIFGIQEGLINQVAYLDQELSGYAYVGVARDDGKEKGEFTAIYYNTEKLELINSDTYWLSETPESISVGWDASMNRITTYGVFRNIVTKDTLYIFNCHYDHIGPIAREQSSELILTFIRRKNLGKKKVIVMGDFNSEPTGQPIQVLKKMLDDAYEVSQVPAYGPVGTFNGFDPAMIPLRRIDYIFTINLEVKNYRSIDDRRGNNLWLSDHLPVMVEITH